MDFKVVCEYERERAVRSQNKKEKRDHTSTPPPLIPLPIFSPQSPGTVPKDYRVHWLGEKRHISDTDVVFHLHPISCYSPSPHPPPIFSPQ